MSQGLFIAFGVTLVLTLLASLGCWLLFSQPPKQGADGIGDMVGGCAYYFVSIGLGFTTLLLGLLGGVAYLYGR